MGISHSVGTEKNGDVRICTDFRMTVNKVLKIDQYPLPTPEDIFATLAGEIFFCIRFVRGVPAT